MIDKDAIIVIAQATALPGNEAALRAAIDEVIPPSLAEAGVEVIDFTRTSKNRAISCSTSASPIKPPSIHISPPRTSRRWSIRSRPWWAAESRISRGCDS
jgi:hypothetical protein